MSVWNSSVLFQQLRERFPLASLEPASHDQQQHLEDRGAITISEAYLTAASFAVHNGSIELWNRTRPTRPDSISGQFDTASTACE